MIFFFILSLCHTVHGQDCGTVEYNRRLREKGNIRESDEQFEHWMNQQRNERLDPNQRLKSLPYKVQVVVHVIHNGEALGVESNISDAQIQSQLEVLNKDFNRLNADAANTPTEFQPVASSLDIEFVLTTTDPNGLPSSGITRVNGAQASWSRDENEQLKSLSYWLSLIHI